MSQTALDPYVLRFKRSGDLVEEFKKIGVDQGGIEIMLAKGFIETIKVPRLAVFAANILKQEMLSLGGDVALSRMALMGTDKTTDCLVMGNFTQIERLAQKLKKQPFGLAQIGEKIKQVLQNTQRESRFLDLRGQKLTLGVKTYVMGILNVTPDSFSGDGFLKSGPDKGVELAEVMVQRGADILDIGGESSRPGARRVSTKEELKRVVPFLKCLLKKVKVPVSIDTTKSEVASAALDLGAALVNDISALRFDKRIAKIAARYKAGVVLMHMKGLPRTMQMRPRYRDCMGEMMLFFSDAVKRAQDAGVDDNRIIIDPGIGFGKSLEHNLEILDRLSDLKSLGRPILVGLSRKRFIGHILKNDVDMRVWGTAAAMSTAVANGADIVRVHDVGEMKQVVDVLDAVHYRRGSHKNIKELSCGIGR